MDEGLDKFFTYLDREKKAPLNTFICYERELRQLLDYLRWKDIKPEDVAHQRHTDKEEGFEMLLNLSFSIN